VHDINDAQQSTENNLFEQVAHMKKTNRNKNNENQAQNDLRWHITSSNHKRVRDHLNKQKKPMAIAAKRQT